jgi:hypothetical protein
MISLTPSSAARLILAVRFLLGTLSLLFPRLATRLMLLDRVRSPGCVSRCRSGRPWPSRSQDFNWVIARAVTAE